MTSDNNVPVRRVMSSNGRYWDTNAQGAADYLLNPVFLTFFFFCVVLYATIMQPDVEGQLPLVAEMIVWVGLLMSSLIWLFGSTWLSVVAYDRGYIKAIYTPLLLVPLVFINAFLGEFVLSVFNTAFESDSGAKINSIIKNIIILVTFDIMHERYVVPQHPRYLPPGTTAPPASYWTERETAPSTQNIAQAGSVSSLVGTTEGENLETDFDQVEDAFTGTATGAGASEAWPTYIELGRERIDVSSIVWIKSEDHYLSFRMTNRNLMIRGKLRTVADKLGYRLGFQINRSAWVAYDAIQEVDELKNGSLEVHLDDGTVYRVSSARRLLFIQNYERYKTVNDVRHVG